jgi:hypothetical protein
MKPARLNTINITRSSAAMEAFSFTYTEPAGDSGDDVETALDLSQYDDVRMQVRNGESYEADLVYTLDLTDGITIAGDDNEQLNLEHSSNHTELFEADGEYWRDIMLVVGDESFIVARGKINVQFNITEKP